MSIEQTGATTDSILRYMAHGPDSVDEDKVPPFKPGRAADHPLGVFYQSPWEEPQDGFSEHGRRCARALADTGCPVLLRSFNVRIGGGETPDRQKVEEQMKDLLFTSITRMSVQVHHAVLHGTLLRALTRHRYMNDEENRINNRLKVLSTIFEMDRVSPESVKLMNELAQVWVACKQSAIMLSKCGVHSDRIRIVPIPYFPNDPHLALRGRKRLPGPPRFYHIGKWEARKAQDKILGAFLSAFEPGEASLILKTSPRSPEFVGYPMSPTHAMHDWLDRDYIKKNGWTQENVQKSVFVTADYIPAARLLALHSMGDCYVTLSRGEGFDMPAFDAKLAGNLMVYTPSGGPQDFAGLNDQRVEPSGSVACHPYYGWDEDAEWLDFDVGEAAFAMRKAHASIMRGIGGDVDLDAFRAKEIGPLMLKNLQEVVEPMGGKVF